VLKVCGAVIVIVHSVAPLAVSQQPAAPRAQAPSTCPTGAEWRRLEPEADLRAWPVVRDIGAANRLGALQRVMQARLCEKAGESERAANYYYEAHELLIQAVPQKQLDDLLARSTALRAKAREASRERAAGFSFDDLRIQLSEAEDSPAVARVHDGQKFYNVSIVRQLVERAHLEIRRTVRSREEGESFLGHITLIDSIKHEEGAHTITSSDSAVLALPKNASNITERTYDIIVSVTMNGVTQSRKTSLTVYR
jgi:hypothetical protein